MKNLFAVVGLFFAFTITAFAQDAQKKDPRVLAKEEVHSLTKVINIENEVQIQLNDLMLYKHEMMTKFPEKKEAIAKDVEGKLEGTLTAEQFAKVKLNKVLFKDLLY